MAMAIYLGIRRGTGWLGILLAFSGLSSLILFAYYREWAGCVFLIIIAIAVYYSSRSNNSVSLLIFSGLVGFLVAQLAITTLPYGWKAWAIPGVLFTLAGLIALLEGYLDRLPRLPGQGQLAKRGTQLLYAAFCLLITLAAIALLMHVPDDAGPGLADAAAAQTTMPAYDAAIAPIDQESQEDLEAEIITPEDVRTIPQGESILFQARSCEKEPCQYLWWSDRDGILADNQSFSREG